MIATLIPYIIKAAEESSYIIFVKDEQDNFVYLNKAACLATKTDIETIKNKTFVEGSKEKEIYDSLFANDIEVIAKGVPRSELYSIGKGDPFSIDSCYYFTKQPIKTEDGKNYILGFGVEITNQLVENSTLSFFKEVLNQMVDSFIITESTYPFRIRYANKAFLQLAGCTSFEEVLGKTPTSLLKKFKKEDELRQQFNEKLASKQVCDVVFTNTNKAGKEFKTHLLVVPITSNYFVGIQRDITEAFNNNQELRKKTAQITAIFNNINSYLWLLSPDFTILNMNRAALQSQQGSNPSFIEGRWWRANQESKEKLIQTLNLVVTKGIKQEIVINFLTSDDDVRDIRLTINPNRDADGIVDYIVVDGADITELKNDSNQYKSIALASVAADSVNIEKWKNSGLNGEDLERVVKTETTVDNLTKTVSTIGEKVDSLSQDINDREKGLFVEVSDLKEGQTIILEKLNATEGLLQIWGWAQKVPSIVKSPIVKWLMILLLGSSILNTFGTTISKVNRIVHPNQTETN